MTGKFFILSIFLLVSFFQIPLSKGDKKVKCYGPKGMDKVCTFQPADKDTPDLSKCEKIDCKYGCGREWIGGNDGVKHVNGDEEGPKEEQNKKPKKDKNKEKKDGKPTRRRRDMMNTLENAMSSVQLGCVSQNAKSDKCEKLSEKAGKGLCVCNKDLCNSASNIAPATFVILTMWTLAMIQKGMNV